VRPCGAKGARLLWSAVIDRGMQRSPTWPREDRHQMLDAVIDEIDGE